MAFKKLRVFGIMLLMAVTVVGVMAPVTQAVTLETGNGRIDRTMSTEAQTLTNFNSSITTYKLQLNTIGGLPDPDELKEVADRIAERNADVQAINLPTAISAEFNETLVEVKAAAQALTNIIQETASREFATTAEARAASEEVEVAHTTFEEAATKLEQAAAAYEPPSPVWLIPLFGGMIAAFIIIIVIAVRKSAAKTAAAVFGDDPAAAQLTKEQKKQIVRYHNDIKLFERALNANDANGIKVYQMSVGDELQGDEALNALGKYGTIAYEYRALLKFSNGDTAGAKSDALKASQLSPNGQLVTDKARGLL